MENPGHWTGTVTSTIKYMVSILFNVGPERQGSRKTCNTVDFFVLMIYRLIQRRIVDSVRAVLQTKLLLLEDTISTHHSDKKLCTN